MPAGMGVRKSPRLAHVQVHMYTGLRVHICVPCAHPKYKCCTRHTAHTWGHEAQVCANRITGPWFRAHPGVIGMLFLVLYPQHSPLPGSLQLKAAKFRFLPGTQPDPGTLRGLKTCLRLAMVRIEQGRGNW